MRLSINLSSKGKAVANFAHRHFGGFGDLGPGYKLWNSNSQIAGLEGESDVQTSKVMTAGPWVSVIAQECTRQGPGACLLGLHSKDPTGRDAHLPCLHGASRPAAGGRLFSKGMCTHLEEIIGQEASLKLLLLR